MPLVVSGRATAADVDKEVAKVLDLLTAADESVRRGAVAGVLRVSPPAATLSLFIDGLIDRLVRCGEAVARRAAASLAGLGGGAVPALRYRLVRACGARQQVRLADALRRASAGSPRAGGDLATTIAFLIALRRAANSEAAAAIVRASLGGLTQIRPAPLRPNRPRRGRYHPPGDPLCCAPVAAHEFSPPRPRAGSPVRRSR
jgi:hypothetical protein